MRSGKLKIPARLGESLGLIGVLVGVIVVFSLMPGRFLSLATFHSVANQVPALAVIAVGMTFVIITAGIDLSVGSVLAFSGAIFGVAMLDWHWPFALAVPLAVLTGSICGLANGWISVRFAVPSFIVTLGMMQIARGLAYLGTDSQTRYIGSSIEWLGAPLPGIGISAAFIIAVVLVIVGQVILDRTVFGRYVLVTGANDEAARYSGINTRPVKIIVFVLAGGFAGLAAVFESSRLQSVVPEAGMGLELAAIAAVVIGGTSLMGGRGSVTGSFLGVLIMATLGAGLDQIGSKDWVKYLVTGLVIILAVIVDVWRVERLKKVK